MIFEKQIVDGYKSMIYTRCDDVETVYYFSSENFDGLIATPHAFPSSMGHTLAGCFYEYENAIPNRLVVFDHGFGGGHRAYMKEIEMLCRRGYRVFAYDHTGCMQSGGDTPNGLAQSLHDLDDCITMLKADPRCEGCDVSVMGHSWGGFSTLNIPALHPEISHTVVLSGFVSVEKMLCTFFAGLMKGYRKPVLALETASNPKYVGYNAVDTLRNASAKALLIYSADDKLCSRYHYDLLKAGLEGQDNVELLLVEGKGHNPNYTADAVRRLGEFTKARTRLLKNKKATAADKSAFVASFDWEAMTEQDGDVWEKIFAHLEK